MAATSIGGLAAAIIVLIVLPKEYFLKEYAHPLSGENSKSRHPIILILLNCAGIILVLIGVMMLFTPGPGILAILIGVMLMNFPGKRSLELRLVGRPGIWKQVNGLRIYFHKPPFLIDTPID